MKKQMVLFAIENLKITSSVLHSIATDKAETLILTLTKAMPVKHRLGGVNDILVNVEGPPSTL